MNTCTDDTSAPGGLRGAHLHRFGLLWVGLIVLFACYGFFGPGESDTHYDTAYREALMYGAFGIGVATCPTVGLFLIGRTRSHGLGKGWALLILALSTALSIATAPLAMAAADDALFNGRIFHGESGLLIYAVAVWTLALGALGFIVFAICILCTRGRCCPTRALSQ